MNVYVGENYRHLILLNVLMFYWHETKDEDNIPERLAIEANVYTKSSCNVRDDNGKIYGVKPMTRIVYCTAHNKPHSQGELSLTNLVHYHGLSDLTELIVTRHLVLSAGGNGYSCPRCGKFFRYQNHYCENKNDKFWNLKKLSEIEGPVGNKLRQLLEEHFKSMTIEDIFEHHRPIIQRSIQKHSNMFMHKVLDLHVECKNAVFALGWHVWVFYNDKFVELNTFIDQIKSKTHFRCLCSFERNINNNPPQTLIQHMKICPSVTTVYPVLISNKIQAMKTFC